MITDKDVVCHKNYIEILALKKFNIKIFFTKKNYGSVSKKSREEILKDFNLENKKLFSTHQTHSDNIVFVDEQKINYFENTDGLISKNSDSVLLTKYADCLPIFFYDESSRYFGVVHSGWRGSYQEIILKAIKSINENMKLENFYVVFGVGISAKNYEVKNDFYEQFKNKFNEKILNKSFFKADGKLFFDNQAFNFELLKDFGLPEKNIYCNNFCTFDGFFHSYRRDKELSGRNAALIFKGE